MRQKGALSVLFLLALIIGLFHLAGCSASTKWEPDTTEVTATIDLQNLPAASIKSMSALSKAVTDPAASVSGSRILWMSVNGEGFDPFYTEMDVTGKTVVTQTFTVPSGVDRHFFFELRDESDSILWRGWATQYLHGPPTTLNISALTAPFSVAGIYPTGTDVPIDKKIFIVFNRTVDPATVTLDTIRVEQGGQAQITGKSAVQDGAGTFKTSRNIVEYLPASLEPRSIYYVHVLPGIKDTQGNSLPAPVTRTFQTGTTGTKTGPKPVSIFPANGATAVSTTVNPTVTFNQTLMPDQPLSTLCTLMGPDGPVSGTPTLGETTNSIFFNPSQPLTRSKRYTLSISADLLGSNGARLGVAVESAFTTETEKLFTLTGTNPPNGATDISRNYPATLIFSQPVDPNSVDEGVTVSTSSGTLPPYGWTTSGNGIIYAPNDPNQPWPANTRLGFTPNDRLRSVGGTTFSGGGSLSFNTQPDSSIFTFVNYNPPSGSTIALNTPITAIFNNPVDPNSVQSGISVLTESGGPYPVPVTPVVNDKRVTFTPNPQWLPGKPVVIMPNHALRDKGGNYWVSSAMHNSALGTFTPVEAPPFTLTGTNPPNGATGVSPTQPVTLTFSDLVDPNTVSGGIAVSTSTGTLPPCNWSTSGNNVICDPNSPWPANAQVGFVPSDRLRSTAGVPFSGGSLFFNTALSAFYLTGSDPPNGATGVSPTQPVTLNFSDSIDPNTIGEGVTVTSTGTLPPYGWTASESSIIYAPNDPNQPWPADAQLGFVPNDRLQSTGGVPFSGEGSLFFNTGPDPNTFALVNTIPPNGGRIPHTSSYVFEYSQEVDSSTIWGSYYAYVCSSCGSWFNNPVSCEKDPGNGKRVNCRNGYGSGWEPGHQYQIHQKTSLKSLKGKSLHDPAMRIFFAD